MTLRSARAQVRGVAGVAAATLIIGFAGPTPAHATQSALPPTKVDNPYAGGKGYVNPEWKAKANSVPGGARVSNTPTAVWLDSVRSITGDINGEPFTLGVRDHLDEALKQGATYAQFVLYDLPGRDCDALSSDADFRATELDRYQREYVDKIAAIQADPKYHSLRIINIVEPSSLTDLTVTSPRGLAYSCTVMAENGNFQKGIAYALGKLAAIPNVYNYLDAGHHGLLGRDEPFAFYTRLLTDTAQAADGGLDSVHGFIVNTGGYSATVEPFLSEIGIPIGPEIASSRWVDGNSFLDESTFALRLRQTLVSLGFSPSIGVLIDTSRNGWGGPDRPTSASTATDLNQYVDESRIDRRIHIGNWCNQSGAGLGERPTADPAPGVDAYVWAKPPGESDGVSGVFGPWVLEPMCNPTYSGNLSNGNNPTGARPNAPDVGEWSAAHFEELMRNAYPPL